MPVLEDGQIFERYQIIRWLGAGVAGESYEAEDRLLLRKVTLKLIHPWVTLPDAARRQFFREMQGISTLNHPYLAAVLDYGEIDGRMYVARRYVSSGSLLGENGRLWFRPPLPLESAFKYAHQLAQTLQYIHQHGYLHGSLSFANVLVLRGPNVEQEPDYAPFLLADVGLTNFVRRFGSPRIEALPVSAAPEQLGKRVTPASDQFALAVLLYFWLAGRPPYLGTPDEVEQLKLTEKITPLSTLNAGVTAEQDGIILRALTVYPEERHATILAFTDALLTSLTSPAPIRPGNPFPEQPETPREILNRPLPALRKAPALRPATEDESEAKTVLSNEQPSAPVFIANIPETPLPLEQPASMPASQDTPVLAPAEPEEMLSGLEPTPRPGRDASSEEPAAVRAADEPASQQEVPSTHEEAVSSAPELTPTLPTLATSDDETGTFASNVLSFPATELSSQSVEKVDSQQPTDLDTLAPRLLISSPYTNHMVEFLLSNEETSVGRASASDLLLDHDNLTSRRHALFQRVGTRVLVFDKRSNNGVFINGQQIAIEQGYELVDGDHISIGSYELIFRCGQASNVS